MLDVSSIYSNFTVRRLKRDAVGVKAYLFARLTTSCKLKSLRLVIHGLLGAWLALLMTLNLLSMKVKVVLNFYFSFPIPFHQCVHVLSTVNASRVVVIATDNATTLLRSHVNVASLAPLVIASAHPIQPANVLQTTVGRATPTAQSTHKINLAQANENLSGRSFH